MWLMYNDPQFLEGRQPYSAHGIDRQAQAEALEAICRLYKKILKINITLDSYEIITMDPSLVIFALFNAFFSPLEFLLSH